MFYQRIFELLVFLSEGVMFFYYVQSLFEQKKNNCKAISVSILGYIVLMGFYLFASGFINTVCMLIINVFLFKILFHCNFKNAIFHSSALVLAMLITEFMSALITSMVLKADFDVYSKDTTLYILNLIFSKMLYFIFCLLLTKLLKRSKGKFAFDTHFLILMIVPLSALIVLTFLYNIALNIQLSETFKIACSISAIILVFSNIVLFFVYERSVKNANELIELKTAEQKAETDKTYFEILEKNNDNLKIFTHDIKNHLLHIANLAQNEEVSDYIADLCGTVTKFGNSAVSKNKTLDIIINKYLLLCESKQIHIYFDTKTANLSFIEPTDLTALLNNLLDNAVEAVENSSEKEIIVKLFTKNNSIQVINITNSCNAELSVKNKDLLTIKKDKNLHGLGLKSVKRIVDKYNGSFEWDYKKEKKTFEVCIIF